MKLNAARSMYVDDFAIILGDTAAENTLLKYAQANDFNSLLLYDLHIVNTNYDLTNTTTNFVLADFIKKAKTVYSIETVSAVAENAWFFSNIIDVYNNSRSISEEKFDIYNLEFEYWINASVEPGGYYCNTYLTPNGYPCNENGAFQYYVTILDTMNSLATNNLHIIKTEAYLGWPSASQADTIGSKVDRLLLHAYVQNPYTAFGYSDDRLIDFANGNPDLEVSIIFSAEQVFMKDWLETNSMSEAEEIFTNDFDSVSSFWTNNIDLQDFTYFTYGEMSNIYEPVIEEPNNINEELVDDNIFTITKNIISIQFEKNITNAIIYNLNGEKMKSFATKENHEINIENLSSGLYFLKVYFKSDFKSFKFIKSN